MILSYLFFNVIANRFKSLPFMFLSPTQPPVFHRPSHHISLTYTPTQSRRGIAHAQLKCSQKCVYNFDWLIYECHQPMIY